MYNLLAELFPICRSSTGDGVRETLRRLQSEIPLRIQEVPTGTPVFDWEVPQEWNIRDAYVADESGQRLVDFRESNLHVVGGSLPVDASLPWSEIRTHVYTLPDHPDWIPFRTGAWQNTWGFCISHRQYEQFEARGEDAVYSVRIDASREDGSLTCGELILPGSGDDDVLISTHICHPSLANDGLSGVVIACELARWLQTLEHRCTYRFIFIPATIGAITWLSQNEADLHRIRHGLVLSLLGDPGAFTYRQSRGGDAMIDRAIQHVLRHTPGEAAIEPFEPFGYDQRQFCSPGINLPVGNLMRTANGRYPEYHTSADDLNLVCPTALAESLEVCRRVIDILEQDAVCVNLRPMCEPRLGQYGLYHAFGTRPDQEQLQRAVLWVLNFSDGDHSLLDIAERADLPFAIIRGAADALLDCGLLETGRPSSETSRPGQSSYNPVPDPSLSGS